MSHWFSFNADVGELRARAAGAAAAADSAARCTASSATTNVARTHVTQVPEPDGRLAGWQTTGTGYWV